MALTLTANLAAPTLLDPAIRLTVTGTVPDAIDAGYQFRLDDELLELKYFGKTAEFIAGGAGAQVIDDRATWYAVRGVAGTAIVSHTAGTALEGVNEALVAGTGETVPDPFASGGGGGSGLPEQWTDGGNGDVEATVDDLLKVPLTIVQPPDPAFGPGAPALIVKASDDTAASTRAIVFQNAAGDDRISFNAPGAQINLNNGTDGLTLSAANGLQTPSIGIGTSGGVVSHPTDSGSDGILIRGDDLVPADGGGMIRFINPIGDMPDLLYGTDPAGNLTINADMSDGAAEFLLKGATPDGTVVAARIPMIPGGYALRPAAHVADGSTVNQLRDALVAAGLMEPA